jgi:hypothetical protein
LRSLYSRHKLYRSRHSQYDEKAGAMQRPLRPI